LIKFLELSETSTKDVLNFQNKLLFFLISAKNPEQSGNLAELSVEKLHRGFEAFLLVSEIVIVKTNIVDNVLNIHYRLDRLNESWSLIVYLESSLDWLFWVVDVISLDESARLNKKISHIE